MGSTFDAAVGPVSENLLGLLDAAANLGERHGYTPAVASPAVAELADEHRYRGDWGDEPVLGAHTWAGVLFAGAENQLRTMTRIVTGGPSLFGPQSLCRSGLEMAARARWIAEPGIGTRRRVARYQTERLHSAMQTRRLAGDNDHAIRIEKEVTGTANALGFELIRGKREPHSHVLERRPDGTAAYQALLDDAGEGTLGKSMFSYLSAVDHGTIYGILSAVTEAPRSGPKTSPGTTLAAMVMRSGHTRMLLIVATLGFALAAHDVAALNGWDDHHWSANRQNALQAARQHLAATPL